MLESNMPESSKRTRDKGNQIVVNKPIDLNEQIDRMKTKVSNIDLPILTTTIQSMIDDLTSQNHVVINDSKRLNNIIKYSLTKSPIKRRRLKQCLPPKPITIRWTFICTLAKLVVLQHLAELHHDFEIHVDLVLDPKHLTSPDGIEHPTRLKTHDDRPIRLRDPHDHSKPSTMSGLSFPLGVPRNENWALMSLGSPLTPKEHRSLYGSPFTGREDERRCSPNDVLTKIAIELAGLDSYDPQVILDYSMTQHDFIMSEIGLLAHDDRFIDDVYSSLIHGCRLASTNKNQNESCDDAKSGHKSHTRDDLGYDSMSIPSELKQLLMLAVLGSCRMRPCDEIYDARTLTADKLQRNAVLAPRRMLYDDALDDLYDFLGSRGYDTSMSDWNDDSEMIKWHTGSNAATIPTRFKDVAHLFTDGQDSWSPIRTKPAWTDVSHIDWSLFRHYSPIPQLRYASMRDQDITVPGVPLSDSILSAIPKSIRRQYTEDKLREIEDRTHLISGFLFMDSWGVGMADALNVISQLNSDAQHLVVRGRIHNIKQEFVQSRSFLVGDRPYDIDSPIIRKLMIDDRQTYDELSDHERSEIIQKCYHLYQLDKYLQDMRPSDDDPYASLSLPDVVVMLSLLCVLHNDAFLEAVRIDPDCEYYDSLGRECFRFCTATHDSVGSTGVDDLNEDLYMSFISKTNGRATLQTPELNYDRVKRGSVSKADGEFNDLRSAFEGMDGVLVDAVIHRLAIELDSGGDGDLPESFVIEDLAMNIHESYAEVIDSLESLEKEK